MSGVLRRGSLTFDCNLGGQNARGSIDSNLHGGYREVKPRTPEISVIALDFRRNSEDLKKATPPPPVSSDATASTGSDDGDSDVITTLIGHVGRWQFVWTLLLSLFQLPPTFHMFAFVFQSAEKDFWCARPQEEPDMDVGLWRNLTQPKGACYMLNLTMTGPPEEWPQPPAYNDTSDMATCTRFEFSSAGGAGMTLVEEFGLFCGQSKMLSVVEMCFLAGAAAGSVSSGWISDRFGRKHTLMGFATVQLVFGATLAFVNSLALYMTLRVIVGFASMTVTVVSFVLVVELVSGKWRKIIGILNIFPVGVTYVLMAAIAYWVRDWRHLQLIISLPWILLICTWRNVPESPRWLLAHGRLVELYALIEHAARVNRLTLPANYRKSLEAAAPPAPTHSPSGMTPKAAEETRVSDAALPIGIDPRLPAAVDHNANPLKVVFNKHYWRTTCLNLVVWYTLIIIYFGLTLHLSNLGGNIYVNTAIAGTVEALSICFSVFVVLKLGMKRTLIAYMLIPGVGCLATNLMPSDDGGTSGVIALAIIAKCVIGASNAIIPTYTAMQYPTVVRNFGVGLGNLASGIALIMVPYMWLLEHIEPLLPMSIMGVCGIIGAVAVALMRDVEN